MRLSENKEYIPRHNKIMSTGLFYDNSCEEHGEHGCCHKNLYYYELKADTTYYFLSGLGLFRREPYGSVEIGEIFDLLDKEGKLKLIYNLDVLK